MHLSVHRDLHAECAHRLLAYCNTRFALVPSNLEFMFIPHGLWQNMTWQLLYLPAALSAEHRYAADDGKVECVVTYLTSTQRQQKEDSHDIFCLTVKDIS